MLLVRWFMWLIYVAPNAKQKQHASWGVNCCPGQSPDFRCGECLPLFSLWMTWAGNNRGNKHPKTPWTFGVLNVLETYCICDRFIYKGVNECAKGLLKSTNSFLAQNWHRALTTTWKIWAGAVFSLKVHLKYFQIIRSHNRCFHVLFVYRRNHLLELYEFVEIYIHSILVYCCMHV